METTLKKILHCRVKYAASAPKQYEWGPRSNVLLVDEEGEEHRAYFTPPDKTWESLSKGQAVRVVKKGKGFYELIEVGQVREEPPKPARKELTPRDFARVMKMCFDGIDEEFTDDFGNPVVANHESLHRFAITVFIQYCRHKNI